jgi:Na+-translocating ferredoxin:NAD+ oxidoreductase RnfG subunit
MKKKIVFFTTTLALLAVICFCFSATAYSQSKAKAMEADKAGIDKQEQEFLQVIRTIMTEHGCRNSGITMTKIYTEDGGRNYRVLVNHRYLSYMESDETEQLRQELQKATSGWKNVTFEYELTYLS